MSDSLTERLATRILDDYLANGPLQPGDKLPSIRALAVKYGVSSNSIAHAIGALAVQGIVEKRHGSGCYVTARAPSAPLSGAHSVGLVIQAQEYELMMRLYNGVQKVVRREGYQLMMADAEWNYETERAEVKKLVAAGCRAIILFPATRTRAQLENDYLNREFTETPIVLVDMAYPCQNRPQVVFDNYTAGLRMTERLIHAGHRRIAFMDVTAGGEELMHRSHHDKRQGYLDALRGAGLEPRPEDHWVMDLWNFKEDIIREFLIASRRVPEPVTAVIALEDTRAIETVLIASELGIEVPGQLLVVGADNLSIAAHFWPPIATTAQDFAQAGEIAARMAFQAIRGEDSGRPMIYMLPSPVKQRAARGEFHGDFHVGRSGGAPVPTLAETEAEAKTSNKSGAAQIDEPDLSIVG